MPLRIAILETDILHPDLQPRFTGYGAMFVSLFKRLGDDISCQVFNVVQGHYPPAPEQFDALLITGSKADAFSKAPWVLALKQFLLSRYHQGQRIIGICFGHQLMALALGADVSRAPQGWGLGKMQYQWLCKPTWLKGADTPLSLLAVHQDQVLSLPQGARILAGSDFCPIGAFEIKHQVLCFQGHPEFTADYARALFAVKEDVFGEEQSAKALETIDNQHDGLRVAGWIRDFIVDAKTQNVAGELQLTK